MAVIQNKPQFNKDKNIRHALQLIEKAARRGAELIVLPEIFFYPYDMHILKSIADSDNRTLKILQETAGNLGIYLCTGSVAEKEGDRVLNTAYLLDKKGRVLLRYSKTHLFDIELPGLSVKESGVFKPGNSMETAETELGRMGMLVCYDIRFPETARKLTLAGMQVLLVPAAFNTITGPAHWHLVFRGRAVENQIYIAAASPAGNHGSGYRAYGHSMIVDPWGKILKDAGTGEKIIFGRVDPSVLERVRTAMPLLKHRRPDIY